jgi:hypothetical protein
MSYTRLFLMVIAVLLFVSPGCIRVNTDAASQGPVSLSEVTMATSVSADGQPLSVASFFLASTPTVYVTAKVNNAPENTAVGVKWFYVKNDSGVTQNLQLSEESATVKGTRYISFSRQPVTGTWGSGQYSATLSLNGKDITSTQFTVKPVQQAALQAPTISYFRAQPESIMAGQAVTLSWLVNDATTVSISPIGSVSPAGSQIVTPANSAEYVLTATNTAGSTTLKANVRVTSYISDKPDLTITDFWVEGNKAYFKVKNIGGVNTVKPTVTYLSVDGAYRASALCDILSAGQERAQSFPNYDWPYGTQRSYTKPIRVCADAQDVIGEYDEQNNCLNLSW